MARIGALCHEDGLRRPLSTELTFLARRDIGPAVVASSVLHEGVHARIFLLGAPVIARALGSLALDDVDVAPRFTAAEGQAAVERADRAQRGT